MLFLLFIIFLLLGIPIAYSLGIPVVVYLFFNTNIPVEFMAQRMTTPLFSYVLIALPAFLLSGRMMNSSGVTNRLLDVSISIVGRFKGGLAYANCLASMMFASMSGTAVGDAGGLGQVEIKMMKDAGYDLDFSVGITAASSVLGPIIPPSVIMVILGATAEISIGRLFIAGIIPGIMLALALMVNVWYRVNIADNKMTWPIHVVSFKEGLVLIRKGILPLVTPLIIIGGIIFGIFTPTEAAIVAILYAAFLGVVYKELTFKKFWDTLEETVAMTGVFMFIMTVAGFFTWVLTREGLPMMITGAMLSLVGDNSLYGMLIIGFFLIIVGLFLDAPAAVLLVTPALLPVLNALNIDMVHFGIVMIVALLTGILTPPYGICLFVMSDVAGISVARVTKEAIRYLPAMFIVFILLILFPALSTWLPNLFF